MPLENESCHQHNLDIIKDAMADIQEILLRSVKNSANNYELIVVLTILTTLLGEYIGCIGDDEQRQSLLDKTRGELERHATRHHILCQGVERLKT